jgi:hypothetical protein
MPLKMKQRKETNNLVRNVARNRMNLLVSSLYPEMAAQRRAKLAEKFARKTHVAGKGYYLGKAAVPAAGTALFVADAIMGLNPVSAAVALPMAYITKTLANDARHSEGGYSPITRRVYVNKNILNDPNMLLTTIDHEGVHFLKRELKLKHPFGTKEFIAYGVGEAILAPNLAEWKEAEKEFFERDSHGNISMPLKDEKMGKSLNSAKSLTQIPFAIRRKLGMFPGDMIYIMSRTLDEEAGAQTRNKFLRQVMDGQNPLFSFNLLAKSKGLKAVVEGRMLKIKHT